MLETEKWAKYLNESTARGLPKAFDFVKENVKPEEYDKILDLANKNEVKQWIIQNKHLTYWMKLMT